MRETMIVLVTIMMIITMLINGLIGIVKEIIFEHEDGHRHISYELPSCVIVEFKESTITEGTKYRDNLD